MCEERLNLYIAFLLFFLAVVNRYRENNHIAERVFSVAETFILAQTFTDLVWAKLTERFIAKDIFDISMDTLITIVEEALREVSASYFSYISSNTQ